MKYGGSKMKHSLLVIVCAFVISSCGNRIHSNSTPPPQRSWFNIDVLEKTTTQQEMLKYERTKEKDEAGCGMERMKNTPSFPQGSIATPELVASVQRGQNIFLLCMKSKGYVFWTNEKLKNLYPEIANRLGL
jgi:hypothetical protein